MAANLKTCLIMICIFKGSISDSRTYKASVQDSYHSDTISVMTKFMIYDVNPGEGFNLRRDM